MMKMPFGTAESDRVLLENVMKATGCTLEEAKALVVADEELDAECEDALFNLSQKKVVSFKR